MNREILFKAKRKDDGEWVEGDFQHTKYDDVIWIADVRGEKCYRCDSGTLCQYTGLHDKTKWEELTKAEKESFLSGWNYKKGRKKVEDWEGKRIWENDILRGYQYPYRSDGNDNYFAEVTWFENCPAFGIYTFKNPKSNVCGISEGNTEFMENWNSEDWEVIGNIFDNADLLEVE